jgi:hypothetical protein
MVTAETFRQMALDFTEAAEQPHFEKSSFRVNKKIFATLDSKNKRAVVKLSAVDQSVFCAYDKVIIFPVPGKWGLQGWTMIELSKVGKNMFKDVLTTSYCTIAPERLAKKYRQE